LQTFSDDGNAVLVATMSFWRGIDVPGQALRLVVVDRLPFASPSDPLIAARMENLERAGVSPFFAFQVPQAAIMLRQGFGRLIRRQSDRGMVAILDSRIIHKRYGSVFMQSLPDCPVSEDLDHALSFLNNLGRDPAKELPKEPQRPKQSTGCGV